MNPNFAAHGLTRAGQQNRNDALTPAIYQRLKKTIDGITGGFGTECIPVLQDWDALVLLK